MKSLTFTSLLLLGASPLLAVDALTVDSSGTVITTNVTIARTAAAGATEAVRGDDPRLTNARVANGGNAATVGGLAPTSFVATSQVGVPNGVALLDANGKVPTTQLPLTGIAGAGVDGAVTDAFTPPTLAGYYDYSSITLTTPKAFPPISFLRVCGNVTLSTTLSISPVPSDTAQADYVRMFDALAGANGVSNALASGGGANVGSGGSYSSILGGVGMAMPTTLARQWVSYKPVIGGRSGYVDNQALTGRGGGSVLLIIDGNLDMSAGGVITANGGNGIVASNDAPGGGAGGSIYVICTGTITGGTFSANGGAGADGSGENGGGGGGGYVYLVANAFAGVQTITTTGGFGPDTATDGGTGTSTTSVVSAAVIRSLLAR
jgi:hypothetical protein